MQAEVMKTSFTTAQDQFSCVVKEKSLFGCRHNFPRILLYLEYYFSRILLFSPEKKHTAAAARTQVQAHSYMRKEPPLSLNTPDNIFTSDDGSSPE